MKKVLSKKHKVVPGDLVEPRYKGEGNKVLNYYPYVYGEYFTMTPDAIGMYIKTIDRNDPGRKLRPWSSIEYLDIVLFGERLVQVEYEEDCASDFGEIISLVKKYSQP